MPRVATNPLKGDAVSPEQSPKFDPEISIFAKPIGFLESPRCPFFEPALSNGLGDVLGITDYPNQQAGTMGLPRKNGHQFRRL